MKLRLFNVLLLLLFSNTLFAGSSGLFHYDSHKFFQITPESLGLDVLWVYFGALVAGGILSVLIVYNSTKSKKEAINALLGCLTSVVALPLTIIIIAYITS